MRVVEKLPRAVRSYEHVWIPMPDGVRLSARLWIPEEAEADPVPALLEYIPYRKRDLTRVRDATIHPWFAGHGYAAARVDLRGSGESEGVLQDEYLEQELADGEAVLQWLAAQPWCNGRVGMIGISWGGFNALQLAARRPPELGAVVAVCATDDRYADDVHYMGGCLLGDNLSWASVMFSRNSCPPDPAMVGDNWREMWLERLRGSGLWLEKWLHHQRRDEYWSHGSVCEDYSAIRCPVLVASGWADGYTNAVLRLLEHLHVPRRGLIGPWSHRYPHQGVPGPAIGFLQEALRWWNRWLKDEPNGIQDEPMLCAWMQDSVPPSTRYTVRPGRWVAEDSWPSPNVERVRYRLAPNRLCRDGPSRSAGLDDELVDEELTIQSPISVGLFAGKWCSYSYGPDLPFDQRQEDGGALVFTSEPLSETLEILGCCLVELDITADRPYAMVAVRLSDVAPDDKATRVTYGLKNLAHQGGHAGPEPLQVGQRYCVDIRLNDVAQRFPAGHRVRLSVSTSYWPLAWPPPDPARLTIRPAASALELPVRRTGPADKRLRPFEPAEGTPPPDTTVLEPPHRNWLVHRDLATGVSTLEVILDEGVYRIEEVDLEIHSRTVEHYRSHGDDFDSVQGEVRTVRRFRRDDWQVETTAHTLLTSDSTHFRIRAELDAYECGTRVHCESWDRRIPRDNL